jgi:hypothetical protein
VTSPDRLLPPTLCLLGLLLAALTVAACGGGSSTSSKVSGTAVTASTATPPSSAGAPATQPTSSAATTAPANTTSAPVGSPATRGPTATAFRQALTSFAACLRSNGVKLPSANGSAAAPALSLKGVDTKSPGYQKALVACRPVLTAAFKAAAKARSKPPSPSGAASPAGRPSAGASPSTPGSPRIPPVKVPASVTAIMKRFTACMRSNGVAGFPNPEGASFNLTGLHLDPSSQQYKSAEASCDPILQGAIGKG